MSARSFILLFFILIGLFELILFVWLKVQDPWCHYCADIKRPHKSLSDIHMATQGAFFKKPNRVLLGSSRGQTITSQLFAEGADDSDQVMTLNMSAASVVGATKLAMIDLADLPELKEVIWLADYFGVTGSVDGSLGSIPYLNEWLTRRGFKPSRGSGWSGFKMFFDHKNFDGLLAVSQHQYQEPGSKKSKHECLGYQASAEREARLNFEVQDIYQRYSNFIFGAPVNDQHHQFVKESLTHLAQRGVMIKVVIMPYHPWITQRLKQEKSEAWQQHLDWAQDLELLRGQNIEVYNWIDRDSPETANYWDDGSHYTCRLFAEWYF